MKKISILLLALFVLSLLSVGVLASPFALQTNQGIIPCRTVDNRIFYCGGNFGITWGIVELTQKNSADWSIVANGMKGGIMFYPTNRVAAIANKVDALTQYTLIYYGDVKAGINDVYPTVTCLATAKSDKKGMVLLRGNFDFKAMCKDTVAQQFWIVPSSDVDCKNKVMTAWNPDKYLFEINTI